MRFFVYVPKSLGNFVFLIKARINILSLFWLFSQKKWRAAFCWLQESKERLFDKLNLNGVVWQVFAFLSKVSLSTSSFQDKMAEKCQRNYSNIICSILDFKNYSKLYMYIFQFQVSHLWKNDLVPPRWGRYENGLIDISSS